MTKIFAHRGASGYAPENTIVSFEKAIDMEADGIELDVQLTKDGYVVVCHDETIDRTSNNKGYIKSYTLQQLRQFNFNNHMDEYGFTAIATLEEVLLLLQPTNLLLNIELKTSIITYDGIVDKTLELVNKYQMNDRVIYSSFNHYTIKEILSKKPDAYCGLLDSDWIVGYGDYAKNLKAKALHPAGYLLLDKQMASEMISSNLDINVFTVNKEEDMKLCFNFNVNGIFTNYPDKALEVRKKYQKQ